MKFNIFIFIVLCFSICFITKKIKKNNSTFARKTNTKVECKTLSQENCTGQCIWKSEIVFGIDIGSCSIRFIRYKKKSLVLLHSIFPKHKDIPSISDIKLKKMAQVRSKILAREKVDMEENERDNLIVYRNDINFNNSHSYLHKAILKLKSLIITTFKDELEFVKQNKKEFGVTFDYCFRGLSLPYEYLNELGFKNGSSPFSIDILQEVAYELNFCKGILQLLKHKNNPDYKYSYILTRAQNLYFCRDKIVILY